MNASAEALTSRLDARDDAMIGRAAKAAYEAIRRPSDPTWDALSPQQQALCRAAARAVIQMTAHEILTGGPR